MVINMYKKNGNKTNLIHYNNMVIFLFSLAVAICSWILVAVFVSPQTSITIKNVPIAFEFNDISLRASGLEIIESNIQSIDIIIEGDRSVVGSVTVDDFKVTSSTVGVKGPGDYNFRLIVDKRDQLKEFQIVKTSVNTVQVVVDRLETRTIKIESQIKNIVIEDGYILDEVIITPSEKNIKGPDTLINDIAKIIVVIDEHEKLNDTKTYKKNIKYIDKLGNEIFSNEIYLENLEVEVTVPILKKATLPVSVEFLNTPSSLKVENLKHSFSQQTIEIAGPKDKIDKTKDINLGYINFQDFSADGKFTFDVMLPEGFVNTQNINTITVSFDTNLLGRKYVRVKNINLINVPTNFTVQILTRQVNNVLIMGDKTQVRDSYYNEFIGEIDLSNEELISGEMTVPVNIRSISKDGVWSIGTYTVVILVKPVG